MPGLLAAVAVPLWAWAGFAGFVVAMLALDLFVLHRRAHEVSLREAGIWTVAWVVIGLSGLVRKFVGGGDHAARVWGCAVSQASMRWSRSWRSVRVNFQLNGLAMAL